LCGTYDYNCSGTIVQEVNGPADCQNFNYCTPNAQPSCNYVPSLPPDCNGNGNNYGQAACGQPWTLSYGGCSYVITGGGPVCERANTTATGGIQACN
jgi:hypothetical protein